MRAAVAVLAAMAATAGAGQGPQPRKPPPAAKFVKPAPAAPDDVILRAMTDELARGRSLALLNQHPYFIAYTVYDGDGFSASATLGALVSAAHTRYRLPGVMVRVGSYAFDNTNYVGSDYYSGTRYDTEQLPIDDAYLPLRRHLWLATDAAYKAAVEAFSRKRAAVQNLNPEGELADFSAAKPTTLLLSPSLKAADEELWKARLRRLSAIFLGYAAVTRSSVDASINSTMRYLVTTEGTAVRVPESVSAVRVRAAAQAPDGMPLRDATVMHALDAGRLPSEVEMERMTREVAENLTALGAAPVADRYTGPVLFEGAAAGQLFAEVLAENLAVPRKPVSNPGRPIPFRGSELEGRLGSRILPEWMDVTDDPGQSEWRGRPLLGHYVIDLEGVAPVPLAIVEKGVLKTFPATRRPVSGTTLSNGRARLPGSFGANSAGVGNLFVRASQTVPAAELKKMLLDACAKRNLPFGLIVRKTDFPSSATFEELRAMLAEAAESRAAHPLSPPVLVYRAYPDGREELVRGLRFRTLDVRSLKDILAASEETFVFDYLDHKGPFAVMDGANYVAETSVIAPAVLLEDVELGRSRDALPRPPVVPPPALAASR